MPSVILWKSCKGMWKMASGMGNDARKSATDCKTPCVPFVMQKADTTRKKHASG